MEGGTEWVWAFQAIIGLTCSAGLALGGWCLKEISRQNATIAGMQATIASIQRQIADSTDSARRELSEMKEWLKSVNQEIRELSSTVRNRD